MIFVGQYRFPLMLTAGRFLKAADFLPRASSNRRSASLSEECGVNGAKLDRDSSAWIFPIASRTSTALFFWRGISPIGGASGRHRTTADCASAFLDGGGARQARRNPRLAERRRSACASL